MLSAPRPIVEVTWTDANSSHGWTPVDDIKKMVAAPCYTVGYLIHETRDILTLAGTLDLAETDKTDPINAACGTMIIPKKMILERRVLRK